ncbi:MAG: PAS-domain containing protein [Thalassovita sp.]
MTLAGLNLIQQGLSIYDSDLKLVLANRPFRDMFNLPNCLVEPGAEFADTIRFLSERGEYGPDPDIPAIVASRVAQAREFSPHYMERQRPDGRWISVEGSPLPEGGWVAVYTDITKAKRQDMLLRARSEEMSDKVLSYSEELASTNRALEASVIALEEAKHQLAETEARTRQTTEMMPAHIAHVGPDKRYTFSNRRLSSVMPGRPVNIVGQHIQEALGDEIYDLIQPNLDRALAGKSSVFEFFIESSSRRIRVAFTPAHNGGKENGGVYILSMDITRETQARTAVQQTRRRELAAQLTSGMAHDFSNLLTIILGSQSQLQKMELPDNAQQQIKATLAATRRGGALLNRLADITGAREWHPVASDIRLLLLDLETLSAPALPANISLNISNLLREDRLMLDTGMLQDSLLNLILNARDSCGHAGEISITVSPVQNLWAEFIVEDTGPGFSKRALDHALEPFFTTKGGEGSGLGLSMVYDMAKLAGGRIRISNTDKGARVVLRLPLRQAPPILKPGLVLLVEDSADLRMMVRGMLIELGHSVIEAASVAEAQSLLDELPEINAILSDITLQGELTGLDLQEKLGHNSPPLFLMTALSDHNPLYKRASAQQPVLRKPFTQAQLLAFLNRT